MEKTVTEMVTDCLRMIKMSILVINGVSTIYLWTKNAIGHEFIQQQIIK